MRTELLIVVMAGTVLSLFLIVGEIAALRKYTKRIHARLRALHHAGRLPRLITEVVAIMVFFLIQPLLIAAAVALLMDGIDPAFSSAAIAELRAIWPLVPPHP